MLLTPAILSHSHKHTYPSYTYKRTKDIWPTREALIEYEEALALEARVDEIFESVGSGGVCAQSSKTPTGQFATRTITPAPDAGNTKSNMKGKFKENLLLDNDEVALEKDNVVDTESPRVQDARLVKKILEVAFPRWQDLVRTRGEEDAWLSGLEQFDCGASLYFIGNLRTNSLHRARIYPHHM